MNTAQLSPLAIDLGMTSPIFGFSHSLEVTVALTLAGGFAVLGVARDSPEEITALIAAVRDRVGDRKFGVDLMFPKLAGQESSAGHARERLPQEHLDFVKNLMNACDIPPATKPNFFTHSVRNQELFSAQVDAVLGSSVDLLACGVGVPPLVIADAKRRGKRTAALVGSPKHAVHAKAAGVDILVAQGSEAGGHTGNIGTMALAPQILEVADGLPVLVAGGINHGAQIAATLALGAQGAWLGTAWLTTTEHGLHASLVAQLIAGQSEDTIISRSHSGKPCRLLKGGWTDAWHADNAPTPLSMPYQQSLTGPLVAAVEEHGIESLLYTPAGQSIAWCKKVESVAEVVRRLDSQTQHALDRLLAMSAAAA